MREPLPANKPLKQCKANPAVQEIVRGIDEVPKFDQVPATLPLDPTGELYKLITFKYKVFPIGNDTTKIKAKLTKNNFVAVIHHLIQVIRNQEHKQFNIFMTQPQLHPNYAREKQLLVPNV